MIEVVIADLCALLLAPELRVRLLASQLDMDGIPIFIWAPLPRQAVRRALKCKQYLQLFDRLLYDEVLSTLTANELRLLNSPTVLWLMTPEEVDYSKVLRLLSPRRRLLPRMLRSQQKPLDRDDNFHTDAE